MSQSKFEKMEKTAILLRQGYTQTQIATHLGIRRRTVVRYVAELREISQQWLNDLAIGGLVFETKMAIDKLKDNEIEIRELLKSTDIDIQLKARLLKQLDENIVLQLQIIAEGPTILSMKRNLSQNFKMMNPGP